MRKTAAVVVTYNRKELLKECIAHLQSQTVPVDILVIDNASTDGTADLFADSAEHLYYFNTGANLGGAGGFNCGMKKACEMGYTFIWVMDDDTVPTPTAHEKLMAAHDRLNGQYGFLTSRVLWKDGTPCNMNIQKITKWKKMEDFEQNRGVQYASFVSLFLKRDTVAAFGLPYKEFFIWGDDWEYTRRISKKMNSFFIADSVVHHYCKDNNGSDIVSAPEDRLDRYRYSYRNDVVVYRQDGVEGYIYLMVRLLLHTVKILLKSSGKKKKLKIIFGSVKKGLSFKPKVEYLQKT